MSEEYAIAFEHNFQRWDVLGKYVWPNPDEVVAIDTCYLQFVYLKEYLQTRAEWLNEYYNN